MGSISIADLEPEIVERLRLRAISRGRTIEEEARSILLDALNCPGAGTRIAELFAGLNIDFEISKMNGGEIRAPDFESQCKRKKMKRQGAKTPR